MKPFVLSVGGVREGVIVGGSLLGRDLAAVGLASVLTVGDPLVDLVVGPVCSVNELLPLADFFRVVLLDRHLGSRIVLVSFQKKLR